MFVSIVVPCYNQASYLDDALQSVLDQDHNLWECIIVDDGSTDHTKEVSNAWENKDPRFIYVHQNNAGLAAARNFGIQNAKGELILPLDSDDKISSDYLSLGVGVYRNNKEVKIVYCLAENFGLVNGFWNIDDFSLRKLADKNSIFCTAFFKKSEWVNVGGYDINMIYGLEDWEFWIHLLKHGGTVHRIDKICFFYRVKQVSMITQLSHEKKEKMLRYVNIKHADFFVEQLGTVKEKNRELISLKKKLNSKTFLIKSLIKLIIKSLKK